MTSTASTASPRYLWQPLRHASGQRPALALRATPGLQGGTLALVVAAHVALIAAMMAMRTPAAPTPVPALMVEVLAAPALTQAEVPPPPRAAIRPAKPLPVAQPSRAPTAATAAPVLSSESPATATATRTDTVAAPSALPVAQAAAAAPAALAPTKLASTTAPRFDADYLDNPAPNYPPLSRRMHEEGRVLLHVFVEPSGLAGKVELHTSSGFERLDRSAIAAVSRWKFAPARQGAEAVGAWVLVPLVFSLKG